MAVTMGDCYLLLWVTTILIVLLFLLELLLVSSNNIVTIATVLNLLGILGLHLHGVGKPLKRGLWLAQPPKH